MRMSSLYAPTLKEDQLRPWLLQVACSFCAGMIKAPLLVCTLIWHLHGSLLRIEAIIHDEMDGIGACEIFCSYHDQL